MLENSYKKIKRMISKLDNRTLNNLFHIEPYEKEFYKISPVWETSSRKVAGVILEAFEFSSILDLGCYVGYFIDEFQKKGKEVCGVDGDWVDKNVLLPSVKDKIIPHNLEKPLDLGRKFDIVLSLETAENIYPGTENFFIENLLRHAKSYIIFSAARVGQKGGRLHHHRCFHPPSWWASKIEESGAGYLLHETAKFETMLQKSNVPEWYINNVSVFLISPSR